MSSRSLIRPIFYHVVLPPRLPGREDGARMQLELTEELFRRFKEAVRELRNDAGEQLKTKYTAVLSSLEASESVLSGQRMTERSLQPQLGKLEASVPLILHIVQQNAGLLIWRRPR